MGKHFLYTLVLFFCTLTLHAQVTTSGISGKVVADNEPLIGATVQAKHEPSGTLYGTTTNEDGRYSLQGMRTGGPYTVEVSYVGFQKAVFKNITLQLGEMYRLDVTMSESAELDEVVITASKEAMFNSQKTGAAQNFNQSQIQATPSINRSIYDITKMNPLGVNTSGGMSFAGSSNKYNSFQIDGVTNNDVFGLSSSGTNGGKTGANPISLEAIEEIQVVVAPFDVRQGGFTGGGVNAITKSGTNKFHGSAYWFYNNENFYGKTPGKNATQREKLGDQSSMTYGVTLGGPILKDKLFFFANYERADETYPSSNNIGTSSSYLDVKEVDQIINKISQLTGGYKAGGYGARDIDTYSNKLLTRLDWNINDRNKFTVRYSFLDARKMIFSNVPAAAKLNDDGYYMNNKTHSLVTELNTQINSSLSNEFRFGWTQVRDGQDPIGQAMPNITINNLSSTNQKAKSTSLELGTERNSAANATDQDVFTLEDNLVWNKGNHTFTFGTHNEFLHIRNLYITNSYGNYVYNSLDDFLKIGTQNEVLPNSYEYSYSNTKITGTDRWAPEFGAAQLGFYVQDEWKVSNVFSMTYGLRVDIPVLFDSPRANDVFNKSTIATNAGLATDQMPTTKVLWSPRVGFRWNLNDERTTLLRGGAGIFTGRIPFVWISNSFGNAGVEMVRTAYTSSLNNYPADFKFNIDPNKQYKDPNAKVPTSEVDVMAKNFRFPSVFRANLAVEHVFPFGIRGTLEGIYSKTLNNILYENANYQWKGETLKNGGDDRPVYTKQDNNFTQVMLLKNTSEGYTFNITGKLEKSFDFGLTAMVAYTYGQSKSLNDGNSSQAYSGWKYNATYYGDSNPELTWSMFDVRNRLLASVSYRKEYGKHFATSVSLFYNGQTGGRYSLLDYTDLNKDGAKNDLMYVPTDVERTNMVFTDILSNGKVTISAAEQKAAFEKWIDGNDELRKTKGEHIKRNQMVMPFEHHFDFHIAQDFYVNVAGQRNTIQVNFDILNVGNLLNKKWGMYYQTNSGFDLSPLTTKVNGNTATYQFYDPGEMYTNVDIASRWHAQIGLRYIF